MGIFPLTHPTPHTLFAFTAFLAGDVAVVFSARLTSAPFRYLWMVLGTVALVATVVALASAGPRTTSAPAAAPSPISATASSRSSA